MMFLLFLATCGALHHIIDNASDFNGGISAPVLIQTIKDYNVLQCENMADFVGGWNQGARDYFKGVTFWNDKGMDSAWKQGYDDAINAQAFYNDSSIAMGRAHN